MTIRYIYIRHGPKEYKNGHAPTGKPNHDPPILTSSIARCREVGRYLVDKYGAPNMVVVSPYLRTRQTAREMTAYLKRGKEVARKILYIDNNVAEFLGHQRGPPDLAEETVNCSSTPEPDDKLPSPGETLAELRMRVETHLFTLQVLGTESESEDAGRGDTESNKVVWIITHGLVIAKIYEILKEYDFGGCRNNTFYPDELQGLLIELSAESREVSLLSFNSPSSQPGRRLRDQRSRNSSSYSSRGSYSL